MRESVWVMFSSLDATACVLGRSGLLNFCAVALALNELGYRAVGVRIDSGDLAYLSTKARECFIKVANKYLIFITTITPIIIYFLWLLYTSINCFIVFNIHYLYSAFLPI